MIAEAKAGLAAILTGEQVYFQKWGSYVAVPDAANIDVALGVALDELLPRWDFTVGNVSATGFVAEARGRQGTDAERWTVTLLYERGQPVEWTVERRRPGVEGRLTTPTSGSRVR